MHGNIRKCLNCLNPLKQVNYFQIVGYNRFPKYENRYCLNPLKQVNYFQIPPPSIRITTGLKIRFSIIEKYGHVKKRFSIHLTDMSNIKNQHQTLINTRLLPNPKICRKSPLLFAFRIDFRQNSNNLH